MLFLPGQMQHLFVAWVGKMAQAQAPISLSNLLWPLSPIDKGTSLWEHPKYVYIYFLFRLARHLLLFMCPCIFTASLLTTILLIPSSGQTFVLMSTKHLPLFHQITILLFLWSCHIRFSIVLWFLFRPFILILLHYKLLLCIPYA